MTYELGMHPGAVWKKTDFQIHTPRDPQWAGGPHLAGGTPESEALRNKWADKFVQECLAREIGAIAVTDHHDFCFVPYVKDAIARAGAENTLWLFPGVEITGNDSVQCLILFEPSSKRDTWARLFGGIINDLDWPDDNDATNPQAELCGSTIEQIIEKICADKKLSSSTVVIPHGRQGGHKSIIRQGMHARFANLDADAVYSDQGIERFDSSALKKIRGQISEWGSRRRAILPTGDNRTADFQSLGTNECWVRLGEPSTESLRQAFLADEARIEYQKPTVPKHRIVLVEISSGLTGAKFQFTVNDGFTALIGGRGSGKSSILEYIKYGLGRAATDFRSSGIEDSRERTLISETLNEGYVRVTIERNGLREIWTRRGSNQSKIEVTLPGGSLEWLTVEQAQQRFKARAYSQKQLSSLMTSSSQMVDQITGIAAAEKLDMRRELERQIRNSQREVNDSFRELISHWIMESDLRKAVSQTEDIRRRLAQTKELISYSGVSAEDQNVLETAPAFANFTLIAQEFRAEITRLRVDLEAKSSTVHFPALAGISQLVEILPQARKLLEERNSLAEFVATKYMEIHSALADFELLENSIMRDFNSANSIFQKKLYDAKSSQETLSTLSDIVAELSKELQQSELNEARIGARLEESATSLATFNESRSKLDKHVLELESLLSEAASDVAKMSSNFLQASVAREAVPHEYLKALTAIFENCRVRELEEKCTRAVKKMTETPLEWEEIVQKLVAAYQQKVDLESEQSVIDDLTKREFEAVLGDSLTVGQAQSVYDNFTENKIASLVSAVPTIKIRFEYNDSGNMIPFDRASPGQQAAALLQLLLNQEAGSLIIDQPEDDLDNKVIMKATELIHVAKRGRQILFATHNPNFVVNGDADKVLVLKPGHSENVESKSARIEIEADGAIETLKVRELITETMEGGAEAFALRGRKYGA
ncbi:TrlF family AAA-like ATPase [Novosphingopyxis sp. YJ-S2-01]|uniref:TrlF family AAA-like ATPase n=1 Tax=Novosphingopyxis sp. YJ-S2-01 TaxID=2794021 RepID=UPI0018DE93ED|nr:AAA family ATPase [Novosphingopyxis sp. YJ-S2-01]MBH9538874.1 AAA family ATPase [Novosphingopyxis sp. YJ-S2-01]